MSPNAGGLVRLERLLDAQAAAMGGLDLDALASCSAEIDAVLGSLRVVADDERPLLARVEALRARNEQLAAASLKDIGARLGRIRQGSAALRGYSPASGMSGPAVAVDTER